MTSIVKNTKANAKAPQKDAAKEELKKVQIAKAPATTSKDSHSETDMAEVVVLGKAQIVESICEKVRATGAAIPPKIAVLALEALEQTITETLQAGDEIRLGIGKFYANYVEGREGRNPATGEPVQVNAYYSPKFKASVTLKRAVNEEATEEGGETDNDDESEDE